MATSVDVNLPKSHKAMFPESCVVCSCENPNSHVRIITGSIGWWTWLLWAFGKPFIVKAPACRGCAWRLHGMRLASTLAYLTTVLIAFWLLWPYFKDSVPRSLRKWAMMALAVICVSPQFVFELFFARPFDVTAHSNSVDYEFTSREYAVEFAIYNSHADWVKINGTDLIA